MKTLKISDTINLKKAYHNESEVLKGMIFNGPLQFKFTSSDFGLNTC